MTDVFSPRHRGELITLEVIRRISGAEQFIDRTRKAAQAILGESVTEATINIETEDGIEPVPAGFPYCKVEDSDELKLTLYERRDIHENRPENKFVSLKRELREGKDLGKPKRRDIGKTPPIPPLLRDLQAIQLKHDFPKEDVSVVFSEVVPRISPDVRNGALYLALVPDVGTRAGRMLVEQSVLVHRRVPQLSQRIGFGMGDAVPSAIFASIREIPYERDQTMRNFMESIRSWLPFEVSVRRPEISA